MLSIMLFAALTVFCAVYLAKRGERLSGTEVLGLTGIAGLVWTWFLFFRLSTGDVLSAGGAVVWTLVLVLVSADAYRRARKSSVISD